MVIRWVGSALIVAATMAFLPGVTAQCLELCLRQDSDDGQYLVGALTWNEGRGGIIWDGGASQDPGPPGADEANNTFISDPLPRKLFLNASRQIEVNLFTHYPTGPSGSSCSAFVGDTRSVALYVGDKIVGGAVAGRGRFDVGPGPGQVDFPPDPPGYGVCRLRLGIEVPVLEKGEVLRFVVAKGNQPSPFGMAGDHHSVIRLPLFQDEEVPYRYPSYAHGAADDASRGAAAIADKVLTGAGVAGLAASLSRRRAVPRVLVLLLLVGAATAGCFGRGPTSGTDVGPPGVSPTSLAPAYQHGNLAKAGFGSLIGQVVAGDVDRPIAGAFVGLVGRSNATQTDPYGRFVFRDLEAGTYHLRVDGDGYLPFEGTVAVVADLIARVNITLVPLEATNADQRFHVHDYWGAESEITVMGPVDLGTGACYEGNSVGFDCEANQAFRVPPPASDSAYASILPGTYEVNVTLEWDPQATGYATVGLLVQANNDPALANWTHFSPRAPGQPFHIATTWEMDDPGHQHFSTWTFRVVETDRPPSCSTADLQCRATELGNSLIDTYVDPATYQATVKIHKGVVPLEPAHPDFWRGETSLQVMRAAPPTRAGTPDHTEPYSARYWWNNAWVPQTLVPPGTVWVEVIANESRQRITAYELEGRIKTAVSGAPSMRCWGVGPTPSAYDCDGSDYVSIGPGTTTGLSTRWVVPVKASDTDQYYSARSLWVFGLQPHRDPATKAAVVADTWAHPEESIGSSSPSFVVSITAHRDPMPTS